MTSWSRGFRCSQEQPRVRPVVDGQENPNITTGIEGNCRAVSSNKERHCPMGLFTRDIKTMNDLFAHQLQDIYYAEKQLVKALPKMADKATDKQLKDGFLTHLEETKVHVKRLEEVF